MGAQLAVVVLCLLARKAVLGSMAQVTVPISGTYGQTAGFKFVNYTPDVAVIELVTRFSDGEVYVQVDENVRGTDVFVIQPTCPPVNDTLMELLIMVDAMKRASARRITAVLPYYGYARQDRKVQSRVPISARLVADLLEAAGIHRVLALDLHAGQIQGFFSVPVDHLFAGPVVMIDYLRKKDLRDPVIVAPDAGGVERARAMA